jgi:sugar phosphate isomerase/epimerase
MSATVRPATMKGPAIFLAQFIGDAQPFDSFDAICGWAAGLGYKGVQVPTSDPRLIDIDKAAASQTYCDEIAGVAASHGLVITELSTHLQGQLVAVHPAYNEAFDAFAPPAVRGRPNERQIWAVDQMMKAAQASRRLGLTGSVSFTGALAWPFLYPWPQRPPGLIETAFDELALRWRPILDAYEEAGVDLCYEVHPGEDVCDGITFEMFYERTGNHPRCAINYDPSHFVLQQLDYLAFIDIYAERIRAGRGVQSDRATGRLFGLPVLDQSRRPLSLARRRTGRLQGDLLAAGCHRIRPLGGAGVGMLPEERGGRRARRCRLYPRPHHPRHRASLRRLRRRHQRRDADPTDIGPHLSA